MDLGQNLGTSYLSSLWGWGVWYMDLGDRRRDSEYLKLEHLEMLLWKGKWIKVLTVGEGAWWSLGVDHEKADGVKLLLGFPSCLLCGASINRLT